jgi:hypothetical protein
MSRVVMAAALVAAMFLFAGPVGAQVAPSALQPSAAPLACTLGTALLAQTAPSAAPSSLFVDLNNAAPSTMPAPIPTTCNILTCRQPCIQTGCLAMCFDLVNCLCRTVCE